MKDLWLDNKQLDAYRTAPYPNYEGATHTKDGGALTLSNAVHQIVKVLMISLPGSDLYKQDVIKTLEPEDMNDRIRQFGEAEKYLDRYGTKEADESVIQLPKTLIKNTFAGVHQWLNEEDPVGKYTRGVLAKAMEVLELGSPELGPHTSDLSTPPSSSKSRKRPPRGS